MIIRGVARWFKRIGAAVWALVVVALIEVVLCADYHERRWDSALVSHPSPPAHVGEGLVIQGNGLGYYAWLRSLLIDHDWDFDNEFDEHNPHQDYVPPSSYRTPLGRRANQWSVGPACLWAVTVVPAHFALKARGTSAGSWAADGYSLPYQVIVGGTSLLLAMAGLACLYSICRTQARPARAAWATALLTLGTAIVYYSAVDLSMAHGIGTAVLAGMVWYWLSTYGSGQWRRWFLVGVWVGVATLVRWQLATFLLLPVGEALLLGRRGHDGTRTSRGARAALLGTLAACGMLLALLPQLVAWRLVYGSWLVNPIPGVHYHWLTPSLWTIFCSQDRSLFYWTPLTLMACAGALACLRRTRHSSDDAPHITPGSASEPLWLLCGAFVVQVYVLASIWGKGEWLRSMGNFAGVYLARSYGLRDLTESLVVLAPGLAWLLERASGWRFRLLAGSGLVLVFWNLLLVLQYGHGLLPQVDGLGPGELAMGTWQFIESDPWTCLLLAEGLGLLGLLLGLGLQAQPAESTPDKEESRPHDTRPSRDRGRAARARSSVGLAIVAVGAGLLGYLVLGEKRTGFVARIHRDAQGRAWPYTLFVPAGWTGGRPYPLLIYLHGSGARGVDGGLPTTDGPGPLIRESEKTFDMLVLFPQSQTGRWEADSDDGLRAMAMVQEVVRDYGVDGERLYLSGTSMGGLGVWSLAARYPHKWAAIVPICGGGDPRGAGAIKHLPCWCFHGAEDEVIDVGESRRMIEALRAAGAHPRYTEYPDVGHACWGRAYSTAELWQWLRRQRLSPAPLTRAAASPCTWINHPSGQAASFSVCSGGSYHV